MTYRRNRSLLALALASALAACGGDDRSSRTDASTSAAAGATAPAAAVPAAAIAQPVASRPVSRQGVRRSSRWPASAIRTGTLRTRALRRGAAPAPATFTPPAELTQPVLALRARRAAAAASEGAGR